jgi:hypothetical protein
MSYYSLHRLCRSFVVVVEIWFSQSVFLFDWQRRRFSICQYHGGQSSSAGRLHQTQTRLHTLFELFAKQFKTALVDYAREGGAIQISKLLNPLRVSPNPRKPRSLPSPRALSCCILYLFGRPCVNLTAMTKPAASWYSLNVS